MSEISRERRMKVKSALVFLALQDMAIEEIESIEDTVWFKQNLKYTLSSCKKVLEKSVEEDFKKYVNEKELQEGYIVIAKFIEKWTKKVTELDPDKLADLDTVLDLFFKGEFKFVDPEEDV